MVEDDIRLSLGRIWAKMRKDYAEALRELHIHVGQDQALCQLWTEDGITQMQLCQRLGCEPPTLTNMLKKLERYDLVSRKQDERDARVSRVYLTTQGRALQQPVLDIWNRHQTKLLDGIRPEERLLLRRLLLQMADNLKE